MHSRQAAALQLEITVNASRPQACREQNCKMSSGCTFGEIFNLNILDNGRFLIFRILCLVCKSKARIAAETVNTLEIAVHSLGLKKASAKKISKRLKPRLERVCKALWIRAYSNWIPVKVQVMFLKQMETVYNWSRKGRLVNALEIFSSFWKSVAMWMVACTRALRTDGAKGSFEKSHTKETPESERALGELSASAASN